MADQSVRSYRHLIVWQKAMRLVIECYRCASRLPAAERFGLAEQMRRAAVSVPANIAEGYGRGSSGEYAHFAGVARGSALEVETHLLVSERLGYLGRAETAEALSLADEVSRMLNGLRMRLAKRRDQSRRKVDAE